jgi:hypothetical protein
MGVLGFDPAVEEIGVERLEGGCFTARTLFTRHMLLNDGSIQLQWPAFKSEAMPNAIAVPVYFIKAKTKAVHMT